MADEQEMPEPLRAWLDAPYDETEPQEDDDGIVERRRAEWDAERQAHREWLASPEGQAALQAQARANAKRHEEALRRFREEQLLP
jgi:hypothetical protein